MGRTEKVEEAEIEAALRREIPDEPDLEEVRRLADRGHEGAREHLYDLHLAEQQCCGRGYPTLRAADLPIVPPDDIYGWLHERMMECEALR